MLQSAPYFIKWHILKKNLSLLKEKENILKAGEVHILLKQQEISKYIV